MTLHASERFVMKEIDRKAISFADYNPRVITEVAKRRLRKAVEKTGLIAPITWNVRSGRVVGGHQRLRILDTLNGGTEYKLTVAQVDMTDDEEKAANLLLNNSEAAGSWDVEKLGELLESPDIDLEAAGLGSSDVYALIGEQASDDVLKDIAERVEKARGIAEATQKAASEKHSTDFYLIVVGKDYASRKKLTDALALEDNRYVNLEDLQDLADELLKLRAERDAATDKAKGPAPKNGTGPKAVAKS